MITESTLEKIYKRFERENREQRIVDAETDRYCVAVHERGHEIIAEHYGLKPDSLIVGPGRGVCVYRNGTPLQNAVVAWGGVMAEDLLGVLQQGRARPRTKLTAFTILPWSIEILAHHLSLEDREGINAHPSTYASCKLAFEILSPKLDILDWLARRLADKSRETFGKAALPKWEIERFARNWSEAQATEKKT